jgi:hypothetical protein
MPTTATIRLNLHARAGSDRLSWALLVYTEGPQRVPHAHIVKHGVVDLCDHDLVGLDAVVQALAVAVDQEA